MSAGCRATKSAASRMLAANSSHLPLDSLLYMELFSDLISKEAWQAARSKLQSYSNLLICTHRLRWLDARFSMAFVTASSMPGCHSFRFGRACAGRSGGERNGMQPDWRQRIDASISKCASPTPCKPVFLRQNKITDSFWSSALMHKVAQDLCKQFFRKVGKNGMLHW